ncbi:MAG: hypothetical protein JW984_01460 [Deltaproteobacteria bacterium]|uniref:Lipoprotein n=1 Tax=Candidatus Zymogenus saltonus TaxID=2844893 RepID=A0A9D8KCZ2_9DELT|nr:hypothetical protein [Candidatus Zymogenus saltonus]
MKNLYYSVLIALLILMIGGCATTQPKSASYYLSEDYFKEVASEEKGIVMDNYYDVIRHLSNKDFKGVIKSATDGIDSIPKYRSMFAFFYAMRGYSYIILYKLDKGMEDINNLENIDKDSLYIPCLYTYYYMSYAPFFSDPNVHYLKALEYLEKWRETKPKNYFETFLYDSKRISDIERTIREGMNK